MNDTVFNILVSLIPVALCLWIIRHYWRSRPAARLKDRSAEEQRLIKGQIESERRRKTIETARLFGFILVLGGFGISVGYGSFKDVPFPVSIVLFLLGAAFIYAAAREARKERT